MARKTVLTMVLSAALLPVPVDGYELRGVFNRVSQYCGVPSGILYAVAMVESGRQIDGDVRPWPWTLNIEGKGFYLENREAMYAKAIQAITEKRSVDIGLMQTNWYWKYGRLRSTWMATEPVFNVKTGCAILKRLHNEHNDWWIAVGKYHRESDRPKHKKAAKRYSDRVYRVWSTLK